MASAKERQGRQRQRILIAGAAGRDFHNFNAVFRDDPGVEVVAFTAAQIPGIGGRRYPRELAGPQYTEGIPIEDEARLEEICRERGVERVVFAYSDIPHASVMHLASRSLAVGADFELLGPDRTMLRSRLPVIAVSAVRTGCGKSQTARWIAHRLRGRGLRVAALRHPMPYGDLTAQRCQRFASRVDFDLADCTIEEREEYEPYVEAGCVIFAGVAYDEILEAAEREADVILWDGGNNDFPFLRPGLHIVIADALRPGQVDTHHPGEAVARMADLFVVNKADAATPAQVQESIQQLRHVAPEVPIVRAASPVVLDDPAAVRGRRVVVVDDGPTLTHGGMAWGAGYVGAAAAAAEIVDPRSAAQPELRSVLDRFPHLDRVLPAMGYGEKQRRSLEQTLNAVDADVVVAGTPIDLGALLNLRLPVVRARYSFAELDEPGLGARVDSFIEDEFRTRDSKTAGRG